jgi:hypothetical protein
MPSFKPTINSLCNAQEDSLKTQYISGTTLGKEVTIGVGCANQSVTLKAYGIQAVERREQAHPLELGFSDSRTFSQLDKGFR